jgi:hypothetical protein
MKDLSQDSRFSGRDFNPGPPEYEAGVLATIRSVYMYVLVRTCLYMHVCMYIGLRTYVCVCRLYMCLAAYVRMCFVSL